MTSSRRARVPADAAVSGQIDAVLRASRALVGIAATSIAGIDDVVTVPQFRVLVMLYTRGPLNLAAVAAGLDVNPSNASRTCDKLIRAGLLDRRASAVDRRHITLTLTAAGRGLVANVTKRRRAAIARILRTMTPDERVHLSDALARFATAAGESTVDENLLTRIWPSST